MRRPLTYDQRAHLVTGYGIDFTSMADLLDERTTLLVFLRHYG